MNVYFGIIAKKEYGKIKDIEPVIEEKLHYLIRKSFFDYTSPLESIEYSDSGKSALFLFSLRNEKLKNQGELYRRYAITSTGYPFSDYDVLLEQSGCDKECVSKLNGVFSICVLDKMNDEIRAYNNHMRLENIYYAEDKYFYYVSTRALLINAIINGENNLNLNKTSVTAFLHRGYVSCEGTIFDGITETPIYSEITINPKGVSITPIEELADKYFTEDLTEKKYDEFTQELIEATKRIQKLYKNARIGLTGGKDSRMMVLAMNAIGADFTAETGGYDDSPDVIVAKKIAELLHIDHQVYNNEIENDGVIEEDILGRTQKMLFASDGALYGFEGCACTGSPYTDDFALFNGLGGEILRGGYAKRLHLFTEKEVEGRVARIYKTMPEFFLPEVEKEYERKYLRGFYGFSTSKPESMDWIYVQEHMGKWASATMRCWRTKRLYLTPLCDEQLIKKTMMIKTMDKVDDRLIFEIIKRLDNRFAEVPLAESRWTFEKDGPYMGDTEGYRIRTPVVAETKRGGFSWRRQTLTDMRENMANVIFDSSCSEIFNYLNRNEVEKLFSKDNTNYAQNPYSEIFAWNIYSTAVLIEGSWMREHTGIAGGFYHNDAARQKAKIDIPNK